ncbi:MAG TPA: amino acid permease, partial [Actinomycetes bacterium]
MATTDRGHHTSDEHRLHELGYAQELRRKMSGFSNFAVSFTIISILSGCLTLFAFGMDAGGPVTFSISWPIVGIMVTFVALAMAEVCSSYPTAGGLYYWSAKLAKRNAPAWSWFTGWFNLLGQVAVTAGIDFGLANFVGAYLNLAFDMEVTRGRIMIIYGIVLLLHGLLNTFGVTLVALLNDISVWWHVIGVTVIVGSLLIFTDDLNSPSFVFGEFVNETGWDNSFYVLLLGLLVAQYTLTGYDASAHMTEETRNASVAGPKGIVNSVVVSVIAGWILLLGMTFAIGDYAAQRGSDTGVPPAQIFIDSVGRTGGELLLLIVIGAQFFCGMSSVTANSRMIYAFSRDGALPA